MSYKKLSPTTLIASIQSKIKDGTGLKCYDYVPDNTLSPFYFAEITNTRPSNTKTMFRDVYSVAIHCIAEKSNSSVGVYKLIEDLQSALSEDISLPDPFELIMQTDNGVQTIKTDETGEKHAIVNFDFMVCYAFMCKI